VSVPIRLLAFAGVLAAADDVGLVGVASLARAVSSVSVITNALRLRGFKAQRVEG